MKDRAGRGAEQPAAAPRRRPLPTLRDVALRAGVSIGTASHALAGKATVSEARRALVLRAASDIGYRPNRLARSLKERRSHVVGLCAPMISSVYFSTFIEALQDLSVASDQQVMQVLSGGDPGRELARVESLVSRQVDGIILIPSAEPAAALDLLAESHVPAVIVDRILADDRFDLVLIDHVAAMREAIRHLTDLGHRRILFVVRHPNLVTTRLRIETLHAAAAADPELRVDVLATTREPEDLPTELPPRLAGREGATALVTSNSINTLWTLRALRSGGFSVPRDVSLVAFDEPAWGELVDPPLTVVRQPMEAIAASAWRLLMDRIDDPESPKARLMLRNELIVRGSTAIVRLR